jgi:hypothetical protein
MIAYNRFRAILSESVSSPISRRFAVRTNEEESENLNSNWTLQLIQILTFIFNNEGAVILRIAMCSAPNPAGMIVYTNWRV